MKKILFTLFILLLSNSNLNAESKVKRIYEGKEDSKITILVYESLTCSHCAKFHLDIYPDLKKNFIDKGYVKLEYRNFPLDLAHSMQQKLHIVKLEMERKFYTFFTKIKVNG